ncbi:MAG: cobalamin biosynthesis protein P47K [Acidobacteria bacterium]|nr:cobalamin biosynthesis protein P47K [Acidobacteriota bacterium]
MKAELILVGGFLGAGKTTAMPRLAEYLSARGRRVGLITNDQSSGLADTAVLAAGGFRIEEITGGCFCCRFASLAEAMERLTRDAGSNVVLAEPVGSCTDLLATVQNPLRKLYGDHYRMAPLSVLVDPLRALRMLGLEAGRTFSPKVAYVYGKQLEEAEFIVINKCDLLDAGRLDRLEQALRERYPGARLFGVSARDGSGLESWFAALAGPPGSATPPEVDYDVYAEGEALLGWVNGTALLSAPEPFDGNRFLLALAGRIRGSLAAEGVEIAHLKMTLTASENGELGALSQVSTAGEPELTRVLEHQTAAGELILNLRAEAAPEFLRAVVESTLAAGNSSGVVAEVRTLDCFRPARPTPTHRMAEPPALRTGLRG